MKAFAASTITFIFILSNTFLSLDLHWCGSDIHSIAILGEAEKCEHFWLNQKVKEPDNSCCGEGNTETCSKPKYIEKKEEAENEVAAKCCKDLELKLEPQEEELFLFSSYDSPVFHQVHFKDCLSEYLVLNLLANCQLYDYPELKPPDRFYPLHIFHEVFLI